MAERGGRRGDAVSQNCTCQPRELDAWTVEYLPCVDHHTVEKYCQERDRDPSYQGFRKDYDVIRAKWELIRQKSMGVSDRVINRIRNRSRRTGEPATLKSLGRATGLDGKPPEAEPKEFDPPPMSTGFDLAEVRAVLLAQWHSADQRENTDFERHRISKVIEWIDLHPESGEDEYRRESITIRTQLMTELGVADDDLPE